MLIEIDFNSDEAILYSSGIRSLWELPLRRFMKEILCRL